MCKPNKKKGFTLVELMVVITIMAILAAAATPVFSGYIRRAKAATYLTQCRSVYVGAQTYLERFGGEIKDRTADIDITEMEEEIASLTGLEEVTFCSGEVPSEENMVEYGYSFYVVEGKCAAVTYKDSENGTWVFQVEDGTFTELK